MLVLVLVVCVYVCVWCATKCQCGVVQFWNRYARSLEDRHQVDQASVWVCERMGAW